MSINKSYAVFGLGRYGIAVAKELVNNGADVLAVDIDEDICTMYEYFEIFLGRMIMCRRAAEKLGAKFKLVANGHKVL